MILVLLGSAVISCTPNEESLAPVPTVKGPVPSATSEKEEAEQFPPRVPIPADKKVLEIQNLNLDESEAEEQILFLQSRNDLSLPIQVKVVAFNPALKTSYVAWEGEVLARGNQPFSFLLDDMVGDHKKELVIRGLDDKGRPSIDIFRRIPSPGGVGLQFKSALSLSAQGTIDITRPPRSNGYDQGEKSDISYQVVSEENDPTSSNLLDTIKTVYSWKYQSNKFERTKTEKYRKESKNDSELEKLFLGDNAQLVNFLSGVWLKSDSDAKEGRQILFFDPKGKEIVLFNEKSQEVYTWEVTSRTVRNGLYLVGSNSLIPLIKLQMSVTIGTGRNLEVTTQDNASWTGNFQKVDSLTFNSLTKVRSSSLNKLKGPSGPFKNDHGDEMQFDLPNLTITEKGKKLKAAASVFQLNQFTILQVKVFAENGQVMPARNYGMGLKEEKTPGRIIRTLTLQSGTMSSQGWKSDLSEVLKLEQIEVLGESGNY